MFHGLSRTFIGVVAVLGLAVPAAADQLVRVDTRPGVQVAYWWMERPDASATLVLLTGGNGGLGMKDGAPASRNFLVRNRDRFAAAGFNVAVVGRPSDRTDLDLAFRAGAEHGKDLRTVVERLRRETRKPVWLVGTSRGTVSAALTAIALGNAVDGVVLAASLTDPALEGAVQNLPLGGIRVPTLVVHHRRDECPATPAKPAPAIVEKLANAPSKRLLLVDGGSAPSGAPCGAQHRHGFAGMDRDVVEAIADFIRNPRPEPPLPAPGRG
jgi:pimeloyl-ACP methyl ester carboxylesterase